MRHLFLRPGPLLRLALTAICFAGMLPAAVAGRAQTPPQTPPPATPPATPAPTTTGRPSVPMPVQKQSVDYFVGRWTFAWTGPDTPLGPGLRSGAVTFSVREAGKALDAVMEAKADDGPYRETSTVRFDEEKKTLAWSDTRSNGVQIVATGDWSSPLAIRFTAAPMTIKGQTFRVRRTLAVISAGSFSVTEEYSVDGGPYKRLGNGVFTKDPEKR